MASWTPVQRVCTPNPLLCRLGEKYVLESCLAFYCWELLGSVALQQRNILKYFRQIFGKDQTSFYKVGIKFNPTHIFFKASLFKG